MSIQLPSECIEQTTASVASRYKTLAAVMGFFGGVFALGGTAMLLDHQQQDAAATAAGMAFWVVLFGYLVFRFLRKAERARRAGQASLDRTMQWFLDGKTVVAADVNGVPQPDLSFDITAKLRTVLTAVPRAQALK